MQIKTNYLNFKHSSLKNVKLIIGNGFDLACGLESSYGNFFSQSKELYNKISNWINGIENFPAKDGASIWDLVFVILKNKADSKYFEANKKSLKNLKNSVEKYKQTKNC